MDKYELSELKDYILLHGYDLNISKLKIDDKLTDTVSDIANSDIVEKDNVEIPYINKRIMISNVKDFMNYYFKLHKIGYLSDNKLKYILNNRKIKNIDDLVKITDDTAKMIEPFKLPINFVNERIFEGSLDIQVVITTDEQKEELLKKINLYFTSINLPKVVTPITEVAYVHELVHSQIESHKGITKDFYNSEVLSIFVELLYASYDDNLYYLFMMQRIRNIIVNFNNMYTYDIEKENIEVDGHVFNEVDYYVCSKYLVSILKAFKLFSIYLENKYNTRDYIIHQINRVFDGFRGVEEFLNELGISYNNSLDGNILKKLI